MDGMYADFAGAKICPCSNSAVGILVIQIAFGLFEPLRGIVATLLVLIAPQAQSVNLAL